MTKIYEKGALLLRQYVGKATDPDTGNKYELVSINGVTPAIRSEKTGRTFVFDWPDIIEQAVKAGIDEEPAP